MSNVTPLFRELSDQIGGFNEAALKSWIHIFNPFDLFHWSMNVIEILLIAGAIWGLLHAITMRKTQGTLINLGVWLAAVVFMLAIEIPVYFPHKIGLDPNAILFIHNEFTIQFFYDRAPLYIMALYPALMYSCYVLVDEMGVFKQRWGTVIGAITVGFIHQGFYEIFDHFGTQYGWWIWNYTNFIGSVASVPLGSLFGFAFLGPVALTLAVRLVLAPYLQKQEAKKQPINIALFAGLTILAGVLIPLIQTLLMPINYMRLIFEVTPLIEAVVCFSLLALAAVVAVYQMSSKPNQATQSSRFAYHYLIGFLVIFAGLWAYALPDYFAAVDGKTEQGLLVGSLPYTILCFVSCIFFIWRRRQARAAQLTNLS